MTGTTGAPGTPLHLAVALDGAGWHPAAWREAGARPGELLTAAYWAELVAEAERGLLDFVTFEDALGLQSAAFHQPDDRTDQVRGSVDAVLLASHLAPLTTRIGLVPTTNVTHTEPFHLAIGIATLDHASKGRAGWRPQISSRAADAAHFGRRTTPRLTEEDVTDSELIAKRLRELFSEGAEVVEAARRLWDSWDDDAEIRDAATGRFIDRDKVHHIDFQGTNFSVKGPSITPRTPQGQPPVVSLAHASTPYEFAALSSDVVHVTPHDRAGTGAILAQVAEAVKRTGRDVTSRPLRTFADLLVLLDEKPGAAARRLARLDETAGAELTSDAEIFTGTPGELADLLLDRHSVGLDGFRLRPAALPHDLTAITRGLVPELQRRGAFRTEYESTTLRGHLRLPRPVGRYAKAG
ncbi:MULTISPECIES: LLM class flavin-dependent oxidoreductase [Streptomyces]|uniref:Alkanesulfonate monooxygenase SsuD/methylene tetrahydromethanopterin reductase-like flavin-dependent oxidoreductase (Luciferase family) n=1 Tax=Streptomyces clavifer TaxID=68188 RepID=A0ABS4VJI9_9ACTN|nr:MULTISPECIES: LLM class flavin-dependent oxidoreductase [Streptomyces]MBP2364095.1 alkanesulfonate monooxygenase SsuD/methylene tetrahydromethanopterin reductase-like flavin-dependent oxidoreductase (luciferase family) [Streptomyces clavifer]MDX2744478.1 LLM class flavin-dependent oxidoreductase [Streptomyces sp. NRRL_B-2557]RPK85569.1 Nitrilotriacetate monooxygenase component A [Streptomyces sp. ADI97-07]WRY85771.1 LLM class flavin-dependent oxidoreductase [Streptomyces clavifer]WUC31483.1